MLTTVYAAQSHVFFDGYAWPQRLLAIGLFVDGACTLAFTGTMTKRQVVSIMTGIGTIDRMKLEKGTPSREDTQALSAPSAGRVCPPLSVWGLRLPLSRWGLRRVECAPPVARAHTGKEIAGGTPYDLVDVFGDGP